MSEHEWKPGDVVTATVKGRESVRLVAGWSKYEPRLRWCEMSPRWGDGDDDECWFVPSQVTDHRPLVAIDPEDREAVERLARALPLHWNLEQPDDPDLFTESVNEIAAALREYANPKPPRPDEPQGLGAVVQREDGSRWVLGAKGWTNLDASGRFLNWSNWSDVNELSDVVRVLSPGVEVDQ